MWTFTLALAADLPADQAPKQCEDCEAWAAPHAPFALFGPSFYVGTAGLSSVAVRTADGVVLIDGTLPQSVDGIVASLQQVGLDVAQVRYILVSHAHYDHVGGVAALQRLSGAVVVANEAAIPALRLGTAPPEDPQAGFGAEAMAFPPVVGEIRGLRDGDALELGGVTFTLQATPGHTPGGGSWSWSSCVEDRCAQIVYGDSLTAVSADGFRYTGTQAERDLRASIERIRALPCDLLVPTHPVYGKLLAQGERGKVKLDPRGCRRYADLAQERLDARLAGEASP